MSTRWNDAVEARLNELSRVTIGLAGMLEALDHAVDIAKMGGITDERLYAVMHLGISRQMTPTTERVLADAGIDTTPWAVASGEQKMVPANAVVIDRAELPKVVKIGTAQGVDSLVDRLDAGECTGYADDRPGRLRDVARGNLALAEYLDAHPPTPPVDEADVAALAVVIADIVLPGTVPGSGVRANVTSESLARSLWLAGVRPPAVTP